MSTTLNMRSILPVRYKQMLWKDELGDDFVLTKSGEIYRYDQNELRVVLWNSAKVEPMQKLGAASLRQTDDGLFLLNFPIDKLQTAISLLGAFRKRPRLSGAWLKDKRCRLAHSVIAYAPSLFENASPMRFKPLERVFSEVASQSALPA